MSLSPFLFKTSLVDSVYLSSKLLLKFFLKNTRLKGALKGFKDALMKFEIISCCHHVLEVFKYSPKFRRSFRVKVF